MKNTWNMFDTLGLKLEKNKELNSILFFCTVFLHEERDRLWNALDFPDTLCYRAGDKKHPKVPLLWKDQMFSLLQIS